MNNILSIKEHIVSSVRKRRKEAKLSQLELSKKAGVSLGSLKRFETAGEISLTSLVKIAFALGYESDFSQLFVRKNYQSIEDVINEIQ